MAQWGSTDQANNSPIWGGLLVNKTANTDNQTNMFNNVTSNAFVSGQKVGVFGASATEVKYPYTGSTEGVTSFNITNAGADYTTLAIGVSGGGGTGFSATAHGQLITATVNAAGEGYLIDDVLSFSNGVAVAVANLSISHVEIVNVAVSEAGGGYSNGDIVAMTTGTGTQATFTVTTGAADDNVASLVLTTGGDYTADPDTANVATTNSTGSGAGLTVDIVTGIKTLAVDSGGEYSTLPTLAGVDLTGGSGTGASADFSFGYTTGEANVSASGYGFTSTPTATFGATGSGATATISRGERLTEARKVTHAGWVLRREGTGGRAGRVTYETLVAMGSISGDASATDDTKLPQSSLA